MIGIDEPDRVYVADPVRDILTSIKAQMWSFALLLGLPVQLLLFVQHQRSELAQTNIRAALRHTILGSVLVFLAWALWALVVGLIPEARFATWPAMGLAVGVYALFAYTTGRALWAISAGTGFRYPVTGGRLLRPGPEFHGLEKGDTVILGRHKRIRGVSTWEEGQEEFVGKQAKVIELSGHDGVSFVLRVDLDGGKFFWRTSDLRFVGAKGKGDDQRAQEAMSEN